MSRIGNPDRGELATAEVPRQLESVAPIGLDTIAGTHRYQRGGDHDAIDLHRVELAVNGVATGSGFVADPQPVTRAKLVDQLADRLAAIGNLAQVLDLKRRVLMGNCHGDGFLVDIQSDVHHALVHDRSLPSVALRLPRGERNLRTTRVGRSSHLV